MKFSAAKLAEAVGGEILGWHQENASEGDKAGEAREVSAENVCIDSRKIKKGEVFVPIKSAPGGRDGHDFIEDAIKGGAKIYLTSRADALSGEFLSEFSGVAGVLVKDTLKALQDLAVHARKDRIRAKVIGITGTVGKTSVKDFARAAIEAELKTHASEKSENNHLGVPLTLLNAPKGAEVIVAELGASAVGEIAELAEILQPEVGLVTSLGVAHIEGFGSIEAVAQAKAELLEALPSSGTAVLNADEGGSVELAGGSSKPSRLPKGISILTYGIMGDGASAGIKDGLAGKSPDVIASDIELDENLMPRFQVDSPWGRAEVQLKVAGRINISNALAGLSLAGLAGVGIENAVSGLGMAELSPLRMEIHRRADGLLIINDTYNANPTSMRAALLELKSLSAKSHTAILGTMKELGSIHEESHREIAELATELGINLVAYQEPAYQNEPAHQNGGASGSITPATSLEEALDTISSLGAGDALLIKASRSVGLEELTKQALENY